MFNVYWATFEKLLGHVLDNIIVYIIIANNYYGNHHQVGILGSVLGPLLYVLYTAEWPWSLTVMASACTNMQMTRRFTSAHRLVTLRLPSDVLLHLVNIEARLKASQLQLNPIKTQMMWLGSPQQLAKVNCQLNFSGSGGVSTYQRLTDSS